MIVLLCGMSGVGKTTLATAAAHKLHEHGIKTEVIDGDEYRKTLCKDLGFSKTDRCENIRRLGAVANRFSSEGTLAMVSAINPYDRIRKEIKSIYKDVKIVYLDCLLRTLLARDTKGLYQRALLPDEHPEKIDNLTGVNDRFEIPKNYDLYIKTDSNNIEQCADKLVGFVLTEISNAQSKLFVRYRSKKSA